MTALPAFVVAILALVLGAAALGAVLYLLFKMFGVIVHVLGRVFRFVGAEIADTARLVGSIVVLPIFAVLVVLNVVIGRWSASAHFGRSFVGELRAIGGCLYRITLGNPARLFGVQGALEGLEHRVPQALAEAPGRDKPAKRVGQFEGYRIVGSLPGGGSGGKLYVAEPDDLKRAALSRRGFGDLDQVVLKVFSTKDGSTLDQIVREGRALEAARRLGLVLEHQSEPERFWYVMRYVPGVSLSVITQRLHAESPPDGLDNARLTRVLGFVDDLLVSLQSYHAGGLWHKDVKPENVIVDRPDASDARAHLVDFGLVTPIRSAMTLTTHGTEYFRDPELVRQALRGVKVNQIDGRKFDVYSAGAVLYSMIENSFPAHGGLSQITRRCPEALRWVVRRAMTDYEKRYPTAEAMLADLRAVAQAADPFALKPVDLPSVKGVAGPMPRAASEGGREPEAPPAPHPIDNPEPVFARAGTPVPPAPPAGPERLRVRNWWSGRYSVDDGSGTPADAGSSRRYEASFEMKVGRGGPANGRRPAEEQLRSARDRARAARRRAHERIAERRARMARSATSAVRGERFRNDPGRGVLAAVGFFVFLAVIVGAAFFGLVAPALRGHGPWGVGPAVADGPVWADAASDEVVPVAPTQAVALSTPATMQDVLVVSTLAVPVSADVEVSVRRAVDALGLIADVSGEFVEVSAVDEAGLVSMLAQAKAAVAGRPADEAATARALMSLALMQPEVDGILWVAPSGRPDRPVEVVLAGEGYFWQGATTADGVDGFVRSAVEWLQDQ